MGLKGYASLEDVAERLMRTNPRLDRERALWLAPHWARPDALGQWRILGDPAHKVVNANLYQVEETLELYRRITAPVLVVEASDDSLSVWWNGAYTLDEFHQRLIEVPQVRRLRVENAGHMLHHDQPAVLAAELRAFLE